MSDVDTRLTQDTIALLHADVDWSAHHEAFRNIVDKKRLTKLVRNSGDVYYSDPFTNWNLKLQKTAFLASLSTLSDDVEIACIFNGTDLTVLGVLLDQEGEA